MKQEIQEAVTQHRLDTLEYAKSSLHNDAETVDRILQAIADKLPKEHPKTGSIKMIIEGREYTRPAESDIAVGYNQAIRDVKSALGLEERK